MKRKLPPLTKEKKGWAKNRNVTLVGSQLNYNAAVQRRYEAQIRALVKKMTEETKKQIIKLFEGGIADEYFKDQQESVAMDASITVAAKKLIKKLTDKFQSLFNLSAPDLAKNMLKDSKKTSEKTVQSSIKQLSGGLSLKTGVVTKGNETVSQAIVDENVNLIKSIPEKYLGQVSGAVMRSITTGEGLKDLVPEIQKYDGMTYRRAKTIALDQTRKAYTLINKQELQQLGVKQFRWNHSGGGQYPRESHIKISGEIFSFENLIEEQAALGVPPEDRGLPSVPVNCRCTMIPIISFGDS